MGPLALLPLHAAGIYDKKSKMLGTCLHDFVISSYIPTVTTLLDKAENSKPLQHTPSQIFLLAQPNTPGQSPIKATVTETKSIFTQMETYGVATTLVVGKDGTADHVQKELKSHNWVHLACHGFQHPTDPLKSAFILEDGHLALLDIIRHHNPNAQFAYLSACQTSCGDDKLTDEVFHLAAGMLAAGFRGAVATMWSIKDEFASEVASNFYAYILKASKNEEGVVQKLDCTQAAYALDHALGCLRKKLESDDMDTENALLTWVPFMHMGI
jgi:CHAT domain-containing protein